MSKTKRVSPLVRLTILLAKGEVRMIVANATGLRLTRYSDSIILSDGKPYTLAELIIRRLQHKRGHGVRIALEAMARIERRTHETMDI